MTFWLLACALIAVTVVFTLLPMMRRSEEGGSLDFARGFYREREAELKSQLESGEIDQTAFDAALNEQGRRLLALAKASPGVTGNATAVARRKLAALVMLMLVPLLGIGLYLRQGQPGMPDAPLFARKALPRDFDIATAIEKIEAHLARNPNDARGYEVVAPVYLKAGRYEDAANAWRKLMALQGATAQRYADLGEALVAASDGVVSAPARQAFEGAVKLEPEMPKARYYLALGLEQDGRKDDALKALSALQDELPEGPARARVAGDIARIKGEPAKADTLSALPEAERAQAINAMVDGLEARLFSQGGPAEEWQKLIRARLVMGQKERALAALEKARQALNDKPDAAGAIKAFEAMINNAP